MKSTRDLETHVGYWLRFVSNHVSGAFRRRLEAHGVTVAEWAALRAMFSLGSCSLSELSERMGADPSTTSRLVERVRRKGFAARQASGGDRRRVRIELTQDGRRLVPKLAGEADVNDERFFGHLSNRERDMITALMKRLVVKHGWKDKPME